jgi:hypothetical protein
MVPEATAVALHLCRRGNGGSRNGEKMECRSGSQPLGPDGVSQTGELAIDREAESGGRHCGRSLIALRWAGLRTSPGRCRGTSEVVLMGTRTRASRAGCASRPQRRSQSRAEQGRAGQSRAEQSRAEQSREHSPGQARPGHGAGRVAAKR